MCLSPTKGFDSESTVLTCFSILFALSSINTADAGPKRPLTFLVDTRLSEGPVENFTDLAVDPFKVAGLLNPIAPPASPAPVLNASPTTDGEPEAAVESAAIVAQTPAATKGDLLIPNERSYSAKVAVNGLVIGMLGPYTDGALHNISSGDYSVSFTHTSGYTYTETISTTQITGPIIPGGRGAAVALPNNASKDAE